MEYIYETMKGGQIFWSQKDMNYWGFVTSTEKVNEMAYLKFSISDIRYILVDSDDEIISLINFIDKINPIGGGKLNHNEKKSLISKIFTFKQLKDDF